MRQLFLASTFAALLVSGHVLAQTPKAEEDHSAHHPPGSAPQAAPAPQPSAAPDAFDQQMKAMQDMHRRMQVASTAAERAALMGEHLKLMRSGMAMMGQMRAAAPAGGGGAQSGGMGMMGMHAQMERRMALMEQMMQMMVDRAVTPPGP